MQLPHYLALLHGAQERLAKGFRAVGDGHADEPDVRILCERLAGRCDGFAGRLADLPSDEAGDEAPAALHTDLFHGPRSGGLGLLRDLHDLYVMAAECEIAWIVVGQAAQGLRDEDLSELAEAGGKETAMQLKWIRSRMKEAAPQALVVA
jgi:hypothetical protein